MGKLSLVVASLLVAGLGASGSGASVLVVGGSVGYDCYAAARAADGSRDALTKCDRAVGSNLLTARDMVATFVNRGIVKIYAGSYADAIKDFDRAIEMDPALAESYSNKASAILRMKGSTDEAIALFNEALARNARRPEFAYFGRAIAHEISGDIKAAYEDYRRAQELAPRWKEPGLELSRFQVTRAQSTRM